MKASIGTVFSLGLLAADLQIVDTQPPRLQHQAEAAKSLASDVQVVVPSILADYPCINTVTNSLAVCPATRGTETSTTQPLAPPTTTTSTVPIQKTATTLSAKTSGDASQPIFAELSSGLAQAKAPVRKYLGCISLAESTNSPNAYNSDGPYYGKYQFLQSTWDNFVISIGLQKLAHIDIRGVPEPVQDYIALRFYLAGRRGEWGPNSSCTRLL